MNDKTQMTINDRAQILLGLMSGENFTQIGSRIGFNPTTVSREVQKHRKTIYVTKDGKPLNNCRKRFRCPMEQGCEGHMSCLKRNCKGCTKICGKTCPDYEEDFCTRLAGAPYVCTGCGKYLSCLMPKKVYDPKLAQQEYEKTLSESRKGVDATEEELTLADMALKHGAGKGQSINHIFSYAGDAMPFSQRTAYNYVNKGIFSETIRLDLPMAVKMKKRKSLQLKEKPKRLKCTDGRTHMDYLLYMDDHPEYDPVQMDCVEGKRGGNGKVLLTLLFAASDVQIAIILEKQDEDHVTQAMVALKSELGTEAFQELFPVILTDRGSEFLDPVAIEEGTSTRVFFCDPQRPDQKGACERNHSEVRKIFRKGTDITFSQKAASHMMDNINSVARPAFKNKTVYDMFLFLHGKENADRLGLKKIPAQDVNLTPSCLTELD